ncbi:hypothetical protein SAY86_024004 [Trapa natans]|uniref:Uncharacterized protein n=1 Tax=Trapa natans TaxID=22666 RepID=A0AAN7LWP6_TRANT|nr:hypothetical protein SAY86_024004 [Trapa natans]
MTHSLDAAVANRPSPLPPPADRLLHRGVIASSLRPHRETAVHRLLLFLVSTVLVFFDFFFWPNTCHPPFAPYTVGNLLLACDTRQLGMLVTLNFLHH